MNDSAMRKLHLEHALLTTGFAENVLLTLDKDGVILAVAADLHADGAEQVSGIVLPGMPNLHSHAHQRAMAGLAETAGEGQDNFWSWRQAMYRFLKHMQPEHLQIIATQLYVEMLKAGYTTVGEFHYLHHDPSGQAYADPAELSYRILAAAKDAGIGITHLPVLYAASGFGAKPLTDAQQRFRMPADKLLQLVESLQKTISDPRVRIGIAPHSLRAAPPAELRTALDGLRNIDATAPIHIHIAEQIAEVEDCLNWSDRRPVEWLLDEIGLDQRWCLIHATHMTPSETQRLAQSGAVAGLCPTTEANLGDGFFPARDYLAAGGLFGIGSDSHISISPVEELRWLEYGERLQRRARAVLTNRPSQSTGARLFKAATAGGAQALSQPIGQIEAGRRCDLIVIDPTTPNLIGRSGDTLLDSLIFAGNTNPIRHVMVGGHWVIRDGYHPQEEAIFQQYEKAITALMSV